MDSAMVVDIGRQALWATLLVSAPLLGVALVVGLVIGIIQAATSINEMTLSFIPKVVCLSMALLLFGGWMLGTLVEFTRGIFQRIPALFG
jgi:flagellar biosynthetic protein FliQ